MTLLACVDPRMGLNFNCRRLSRDRMVCERIAACCNEKSLYASEYSVRLLTSAFGIHAPSHVSTDLNALFQKPGTPPDPLVQEEYLIQIENAVVFLELEDVAPYLGIAHHVILYIWDKPYPFSMKFPDIRHDPSWKLTDSMEFAGSSHEKIVEEHYEKI